jgi:hypothetical protein
MANAGRRRSFLLGTIWGPHVLRGGEQPARRPRARTPPEPSLTSMDTYPYVLGVIPEAAELVKAGFVVVVTVFLVVSGVFGACGTRSRGPGAAPAAQRGRTAWRLARMAQY